MQSPKIRAFVAAGVLLATPTLLVACGSSDSSPAKDKPATTTEVMKEKDTTSTTEAMMDGGKTSTTEAMMDSGKTSTTEAMMDSGK